MASGLDGKLRVRVVRISDRIVGKRVFMDLVTFVLINGMMSPLSGPRKGLRIRFWDWLARG